MQKKNLFIIGVFFSIFFTGKVQAISQVGMDSLMAVWNNTTLPDSIRLQAMQKISWDGYRDTNPDSSFYYAQMQYDMAKASDNKKWIGLALNTQGQSKFSKGEYDQALEYFDNSIQIFEEIGDKNNIAAGLNNLGSVSQRKGDFMKALEYYFQALNLLEETNDKEKIGLSFNNIGTIYYKQGNLDQALVYLNKSNKIYEDNKDLRGQASTQNIIGGIYLQQGDYQQALEIFAQNLEIFKQMGYKQAIAGTLNNIGSIYRQQGDFEKALENYQIALETFEEVGIPYGVAGVSQGIAKVYIEQENYPLALEYLNRSLKISEETGNKEGIANVMATMAHIYTVQKNYPKAISVGTKALVVAQEMGDLTWINFTSQTLIESYKATGKYKEALEMTELFMKTNDSLNSQENQKAIIQSQVQSEYEKQKAIDNLENEKRVEIETQKKKSQQILTAAVSLGLLLVLILAIGLWHRNRFIKKTNIELADAKDQAERSEKFKEQFLANMSHEIRTPMHAILGMIKILERNQHPPAQDVFLNAMHTSADNLVVILNDVLDLSKIEAGKLDIESIPMNPKLIIENVIQILKYKAEEKGLKLSYKVASDMPSLVMGDPTRLHQILINLTGNAIKFTQHGKVDISLKVENTQLKFQVIDTGIGIPKNEQERIFSAFKQAKGSTNRIHGGTGLGLSISKQLVELQHGSIWLESKEGAGSTFYFSLPLTVAEGQAIDEKLFPEEKLKAMTKSLAGIHILLAEDNPFNQMIAQDDLSYHIQGIKLDIVENGALAVEKFKTDHFDLILMDVQMPEMNGFEATKRIREIEKSENRKAAIPIIAMTASLLKTEIDNCLISGMDNYIPKPYTKVELIGPIFKALKS